MVLRALSTISIYHDARRGRLPHPYTNMIKQALKRFGYCRRGELSTHFTGS
jgi:hypothetical protein